MTFKVAVWKTTGERYREGGPADASVLHTVPVLDAQGVPIRDADGDVIYQQIPSPDWWTTLTPHDLALFDLLDVPAPLPGQVWDPGQRLYVTPPPDPAPYGWIITVDAFMRRIPFPVRAAARVLAAQVNSADPAIAAAAGGVAELFGVIDRRQTVTTNAQETIDGAQFLLSIPTLVQAGMSAAVVTAMTAPAQLSEVPA